MASAFKFKVGDKVKLKYPNQIQKEIPNMDLACGGGLSQANLDWIRTNYNYLEIKEQIRAGQKRGRGYFCRNIVLRIDERMLEPYEK